MPEIAFERKLAFSTIEEHFAVLLEKKLVKIEDFLSKEKIELITKVVNEHPESRFKALKETLPENIRYSEIKCVLISLEKYKAPQKTPIKKAINKYVWNNCARKCFNHEDIFFDCQKKFKTFESAFGEQEISVGEFFELMNSGKISICKLSEEKRRKIVYWREFEEMKEKNADFWSKN